MIPASTYRIQFSADTTLQQGADLVPYLDALGVGAVYASPLLASGKGSNHGYDVVDPTRVCPGRGGEEGRRALVAAVRERGMGFLLDIVPEPRRRGRAAGQPLVVGPAHATAGRRATRRYFDVDWADDDSSARPILLPVLGAEPTADDEEKVIASEVTLSDDRTELRYYERAFPVAPGTGDEGGPVEVHARQHYRLASWKRGAAELTYRRFFDVSTLAAVRVEDPAVFEATHAEVLRWVRGRRRGRAAGGPPGRPVRSRRLRAAAARGDRARPVAAGGEDPRRRRGDPGVVAGGRHVRLRGAARDLRGVRRPGRRGAAHPARRRAHRPQGERARRRARRAPGGGRHDPGRRGAADRRAGAGAGVGPVDRRDARPGRGSCARGRRGAAVRLPGLPQLPAGGALGAGHRGVGGDHAPAGPRGPGRRDRRDDAGRPGGRAGHPRAADVGHGHGQGRRGHRLLPLQPVRRAERGRRRPRPVRGLPRRVPRPLRGARRGVAAHDDHALHARHQALGGRPRPARGARRDPERVGAAAAPLGAGATAAGPVAGAAGVAEPGRGVADLGRAAGRVPGQGVQGGQARHQPRRRERRGGRGDRGVAGGGAR